MARLGYRWAALACIVWSGLAEKHTNIRELTVETLSTYVAEHETVLVDFYTPYSRHCKALAPEFERAASFLVDHGIHLAKYDCTVVYDVDYNLCGNMGIRDFPTLLIYRGDTTTPTVYRGARKSAEDIISHMTNGTYPTHTVTPTTSTRMRTQPSKTPPPNPSPNPTASNAVWIAEDGSQASVKLAIPGLLDSSTSMEAQEVAREEKLAKRERRVLFIRHRLQKIFLSRDPSPPSAQNIANAAELIAELENYENLESSVINHTKIHKVLRKISKLPDIPGDSEHGFHFQQRSSDLVDEYEQTRAGPATLTPESAVLLNLTISADGHHLLLNSRYHAMQIPDPSRPALLSARKIPSDASLSDMNENELSTYPLIGLDYSFDARNRDDPGIRYYNYHPTLLLNLIGAGGSRDNASDPLLLLDSLEQKWVEISLHDTHGTSSDDALREYRIDKVRFRERSRDVRGRKIEYRAPRPDDRPCSLWSWRCADIGDPPWYRDVWRDNFDEHGRVGSLRRALLIRWLQLRVVLFDNVPWWAKLLPLIGVAMYVRGRLARRWQADEPGGKKSKDWIV